jgi:hypothetical protein
MLPKRFAKRFGSHQLNRRTTTMRFLVISVVGLAVLVSPCAYDTDPRQPPVPFASDAGGPLPKGPLAFSAQEKSFIKAFSGGASWNS